MNARAILDDLPATLGGAMREELDTEVARTGECDGQKSRTSFVVTPEQLEFLDRFRARVRRDSGRRITRAAILTALVSALVQRAIPLDEITSETHLKEHLNATRKTSEN
jgi:hypothetical protein